MSVPFHQLLLLIILVSMCLRLFTELTVAYATATPNYWKGICDTNNYKKSTPPYPTAYALGAQYNGIIACEPGKAYQNGDRSHVVSFGVGAQQFEWECVELSMRYMYLVYNISPYSLTLGYARNIVSDHDISNGRLSPKTNNGTELPTPGDILAEGAVGFGHTTIVTAVDVNSSGNGTLTLIEQNGAADSNGFRTISVANRVAGDTVTSWLHDPTYASTSVTFQANVGRLFSYDGVQSQDTAQGMSDATSQSSATISDQSYQTTQGMRAGTNPSLMSPTPG